MAGWLIPEITTIAGQLCEATSGKAIREAHLGNGKGWAAEYKRGGINVTPEQFRDALSERNIGYIYGKGRWLFIEILPDDVYLLFGETRGFLRYYASQDAVPNTIDPKSEDYVSLHFTDDSCLVYRQRGWGALKIIRKDAIGQTNYPGILGISPADSKEFTYSAFQKALQKYKTKVLRTVLINQREISGLNNPYLHDIFFEAGLNPKRKVHKLSHQQCKNLYRSIKSVVKRAVELGGSEHECDIYGVPGQYTPKMGRHLLGQPCPACGTSIIKDKVVSAPIYICPQCQP